MTFCSSISHAFAATRSIALALKIKERYSEIKKINKRYIEYLNNGTLKNGTICIKIVHFSFKFVYFTGLHLRNSYCLDFPCCIMVHLACILPVILNLRTISLFLQYEILKKLVTSFPLVPALSFSC